MKKYFTHNGSEQQGPFDLDDLRNQKITKETLIWFEGIEQWTKAELIPEIKEILIPTPPPLTKKVPPPISDIPKKVEERTQVTEKKTSGWKTVYTIIIVFLVAIGGFVVFQFLTNPNGNTFMKVTVNPPNPRVVESHGGEDPTSTVFSFKEGIDATILNQGGSGNILVTGYLYQDNNTYERSQEIYVLENATEEIHFTFDEAELLGGQMKFSVTAKAIE